MWDVSHSGVALLGQTTLPSRSLLRHALRNSSHTCSCDCLSQVSRYRPQFPSPTSPSRSLLRHALRNSSQTSSRDCLSQVSRYRRQFPSPTSPSRSLLRHALRNSSQTLLAPLSFTSLAISSAIPLANSRLTTVSWRPAPCHSSGRISAPGPTLARDQKVDCKTCNLKVDSMKSPILHAI
jgi:hypothetical protein